MTFVPISSIDTASPLIDAFGRLRVSNPKTIFDSKQIFDNLPLEWDDAEVSGSGTTSVHSTDTSSTVMGVAATTAGVRARQTFMRFNYQPGKSQEIMMTGTHFVSGGGTGITAEFGLFDTENGIIFRNSAGTLQIVRRSNVTGSVVEEVVDQTNWNLDTMDGLGPAPPLGGIPPTLTTDVSQLLVIDLEWLGAGRVRVGFVIGGQIIYAHEFLGSNVRDGVYMSTPNLPLCYRIENDGTGAASTMRHICSTVISEGGENSLGVLRTFSTAGTALTASTADTLYALIGIRLKAAYVGATIDILRTTVLAETNDDFEWAWYMNPTVAGTFTYADQTNSAVQAILGVTANTVSGGLYVSGGFADAQTAINELQLPALRMGVDIAGTLDTLVLCVRPLSNNANIQATATWREIL